MIGYIKGKLLEKDPVSLLVDVNGLGYEVTVPMSTYYHIGDVGSDIALYIHFVVREDAQLLYGFNTKTDKKLFQELIKVSGIGARTAVAILSGMDCKTLLHCIENKDYGLLSTIPGIGKKTAERLIIETYDKILKMSSEILTQKSTSIESLEFEQTVTKNTDKSRTIDSNSIYNEAVDALMSLGYKQKEAEKMALKASKESTTVEEIIKKALKRSMK